MSDEPRIAKYGMPASESQPYEAAQIAIALERAVLKELHFLHALEAGPSLRAALDALAGKAAAPVAEAPAAPVVKPAPEPVHLRAALGLR